jgi:peptide/nickel transport system substrate-binding protein
MRAVSRIFLVLVAWGCDGDGSRPGELDAAAFCEAAIADAESFMAGARARLPVPADERYGGTAVVGNIAELISGMNAAITSDYLSLQYQQFVNLMTLVQYDADLTPQPYLARSWEVNEDTTRLTFHLRDDVYWHDGERTDARDVAFTYSLVTDPETAFPNPAFFDFYGREADDVRVLDDFTVSVTLRPHAEFMDPWRALAILPEHLLGEVAPGDIAAHPFGSRCPVGNGPFVFAEHRPQDRWVFEANPAFPEELGGRPFLDRLVHRVVPEQATLLAELLTGGLDLYIDVPTYQAGQVAEGGAILQRFASRQLEYVAWNGRREPFSDVRVRRALTLAVDRQELVESTLGGFGRIAHSTVPPFHWAYRPGPAEGEAFDPEGAGRLLDEAGWRDRDGDGVRESPEGERLAFTLTYNTGNQRRQDIAEIMQAQLGTVGVAVRTESVEPASLASRLFDPEVRDYDAVIFGWITEFRMDDRDLLHSDRGAGPFALSGTSNPRLDRLLDTLPLVVDRSRARPLWDEYQRAQGEEHPYTFLFFPERLTGVSQRLKGVDTDVRGEWTNVRGWWIDPDLR